MLCRVGNNLKPRLVSCCPVLLLYCDVFTLAWPVTVSLGAHAAQEPGLDISAPGSRQGNRPLIGQTGTQRASHWHHSITQQVYGLKGLS